MLGIYWNFEILLENFFCDGADIFIIACVAALAAD